MKIVILGASGLIGNGVVKALSNNHSLKILGTYSKNLFYKEKKIENFFEFDVLKDNKIFDFILNQNPNIVINCLGITKHYQDRFSEKEFMHVNYHFVEQLSKLSQTKNFKLIHISTDCVFNGLDGNYSELDVPNATDIYGKSKIYSEKIYNNNLVLRTSTVGRELGTKNGLLEWFLSRNNYCDGYVNAFFSGITNVELGMIIQNHVFPNLQINGLFNISAEKINKYSLLKIFSDHFKKDIDIKVFKNFTVDRSLNSLKFQKKMGYKIKSWDLMLSEL